jgi:hypothetical protein
MRLFMPTMTMVWTTRFPTDRDSPSRRSDASTVRNGLPADGCAAER